MYEHLGFVTRAGYILILAALMMLYRILRGPTAADKIVAIDIFGILVIEAGLLSNPVLAFLFPWGAKQWEATVRWSLETLSGEVIVSGQDEVAAAPLASTEVCTLDFVNRVSEDMNRHDGRHFSSGLGIVQPRFLSPAFFVDESGDFFRKYFDGPSDSCGVYLNHGASRL